MKSKPTKKKLTKTQLIKKCDTLWAEITKKRAGFRCEYCGETHYLNSHHIFSRSNKSTRWDLNNACVLCPAHHTFSSTFSAHKTSVEFVEWIKQKRGEKWYQELRKHASEVKQHTTQSLTLLLESLKNLLKRKTQTQ